MLRKSSYLLAVALCLVGCIHTPLVPKTSDTTQTIDFSPERSICSEWFDSIPYDNDPYPAVCSLSDVGGNIIGSGVLVAPNVVVTAGHCIDGVDLLYVSFGNEIICITETLLHPEYSVNARILPDIGLLFLEHEPFGIEPVQLHSGQFVCRFAPITTVGFSFRYKKYSKEGTFRYFGTVLEDIGKIKFLPRKSTIWYGDSGGAVFTDWYGEQLLIGIISNFAIVNGEIVECSATRVDMYKSWINERIKEHERILESTVDVTNDT